MSLFEIRDMRELCRRSQLELIEPDVDVAIPNIFGHCKMKRSKSQYNTGCNGLWEDCFKEERPLER